MSAAGDEEARTFAPGPKPGTVLDAAGAVLPVPDGWTLLPPGDPGLTRRVTLDTVQIVHPETGQTVWYLNNLTWTSDLFATPMLVDVYKRGQKALPDYDTAVKHMGWDPRVKAFAAKPGEVLEIVFQNHGSLVNNNGGLDIHPFHAHGQHFYDIGVAVSTERGLIVPVVRDCDQKSFAQLEKDIADYAVKAREGKVGLPDLQGGVFTITNGGIFGSLLSTPILNPPQSGILGMHSIQQRPVAVDGQVVIRPMMYLALSYDHRLIDGKEAVTFLVRVKQCIENPERILLGA